MNFKVKFEGYIIECTLVNEVEDDDFIIPQFTVTEVRDGETDAVLVSEDDFDNDHFAWDRVEGFFDSGDFDGFVISEYNNEKSKFIEYEE